ncbi:OLC1v1004304C1 [Oldenlandia corymbosa var. corymbosa]|uniref:OLC1v1004304C1 n=1 Tax=Oldenlandia corymbosa var. corymbosa TaxID=529605 RepID=A0AAV1DCR7_OLDCO|nr:OLC1v1004304C1 [Oldenlandia corymbosa var. corymbosa]
MVWYRFTTLSGITLIILLSAVAVVTGSPCESTPDPIFCQSFISSNDSASSSGDVFDYTRFYVKKSMRSAEKFLSLIEKNLRKSKYLTPTAIRALEDCKLMAQLNIDFLTNSFQVVGNTSKVLTSLKAEDVLTLLSAILTNVDTCRQGLRDSSDTWSVRNDIVAPLSTDTKLFRLSLALFTKGTDTSSSGGSGSGTDADAVLIKEIVIVSQDGTGNYTTVSAALAEAPKYSDGSDGYYLIYVTAGVYEEYISIGKSQKYLMMVGDGINRTIITGNHSFVDGWTTFNSSTFGYLPSC